MIRNVLILSLLIVGSVSYYVGLDVSKRLQGWDTNEAQIHGSIPRDLLLQYFGLITVACICIPLSLSLICIEYKLLAPLPAVMFSFSMLMMPVFMLVNAPLFIYVGIVFIPCMIFVGLLHLPQIRRRFQ